MITCTTRMVAVALWAAISAKAVAAPSIEAQKRSFVETLVVAPADAEAVNARCRTALALAGTMRSALERRKGAATLKSDFGAYDALVHVTKSARGEASLVSETNPNAKVREAAAECFRQIRDFETDVALSQPIYTRLAAIPTPGLDASTDFTLATVLKRYRLGGVDRDAATRAKMAALRSEIAAAGVQFEKNIREDTGDIALTPEELEGLPADYLQQRPPREDGFVHLSFAWNDVAPGYQFATWRETRRKVHLAEISRAYPANEQVLKDLLEKRHALAQVLGYPDFATMATADKMIGSKDRAARFISEAAAAARPGADTYFVEVAAFVKATDASVNPLQVYDIALFANALRKQKYALDDAEVRNYFSYDKARAGAFKLISELFGADIRPWSTPVWDPSVSAWELHDDRGLVGRFFLDMHPRPGKYTHFLHSTIRRGIGGKYVPVSALICNFPAQGRMSHSDVTVFLHEFGHLLHALYAGRARFATQSMGEVKMDFIEAPSKLLEEWSWDPDSLAVMSANEIGEAIPDELVRKLNVARQFGRAWQMQDLLAGAAVSLALHDGQPDFDIATVVKQQQARYLPLPPLPDDRSYASFWHLNSYSAHYYTYAWSEAIAVDLFTRFRAEGLHNRALALRYRQLVFDPGASQDPNTMIQNFLGRPFSTEALGRALRKEAQ